MYSTFAQVHPFAQITPDCNVWCKETDMEKPNWAFQWYKVGVLASVIGL